MPRLVVLVNGSAGDPGESQARLEAIRAAFRAAGADPPIECVAGDALADAARAEVAAGADVLVAAGGDGTVSALAGAVAGTDAALAVLPLGTLNHFARDAGLPTDLGEAARVAVHGRPAAVDVARVNGRVFVNNVSLGLYPHAVRERERRLEPGRSKRMATARAVGATLRRLPAHHLLLAVDGRPAVRTTSFIFVGNNAYETDLGNLGRRLGLTGGRLAVYTVRKPSRRAVLALAARTLVGRLDEARDFETHDAAEVVVDSAKPRLQVGIDGELAWLETPLRFAAWPGALRLVQEG